MTIAQWKAEKVAGTTGRHKQKERVTHLLFFCRSKEQGHLITASVKHTRGLGFHCCCCRLAFDRLPLSQGGQNTFYHLSLPPPPPPPPPRGDRNKHFNCFSLSVPLSLLHTFALSDSLSLSLTYSFSM